MKKLITTIFAGLVAMQVALFVSTAQAATIKEIKQTNNNLTLNANLMMADGKTYADNIVLLTHGTLTHKDRSTYDIVESIVNFAHRLKMAVVGEGIERKEHLVALKAMGCEQGQGFYFEKALPLEQFAAYTRAKNSLTQKKTTKT